MLNLFLHAHQKKIQNTDHFLHCRGLHLQQAISNVKGSALSGKCPDQLLSSTLNSKKTKDYFFPKGNADAWGRAGND